jgi:hypothetical protein
MVPINKRLDLHAVLLLTLEDETTIWQCEYHKERLYTPYTRTFYAWCDHLGNEMKTSEVGLPNHSKGLDMFLAEIT